MTIQIDIKAREMEVNDRLNDYVVSKAEKLERYLDGITKATIELTYVKSARQVSDRQNVEITVSGKGFVLRSEERSDDIYVAFDSALEKLHRRIEKFKGKRNRKRGDGLTVAESVYESFEPMDEEAEEPVIIRRKKFTLIPMDEYEAILQGDLTGHEDFFVFYNMNTDSVNVLYKRRDGNYGLIETEIG
ncbi:MAG: ribosome-associated translation inhibitor RaiA [Chloroflexi bacterium]|jgi:putative sigma-54 modulation protein|nr:ribosome-associated translation inhibitor RaiA [Chloroflexota bacterium]MBT3670460.1 ribosome-associated translation inhibitor RaiA [Chloroflexota bacterium]MBT4002291.1 ribosome-associated translation inhibitor RaiA [Chloroflexota bacterium]MBT4304638.1 ribosome-associated translation inhibitor RaiA [Chloroflexota bacterium]MBT4534207.1 ribosome-associated translation inhibitor RaiA [Chloroflexota bacterium]